jgi:hypothetical protein
MILEQVDRRVLGAIRFLDATTQLTIVAPIVIEALGLKLVRNPRGYYVIFKAPGFENYTQDFLQPPIASSINIELKVSDPTGQYLPRRKTIGLPRDPTPPNASQTNSLFKPIDVLLFLAPIGQTAIGWAIIRASVTQQGTNRPLSGALLRVLRASDLTHLASGLTDSRGEALVAVTGIPITTWEEQGGPLLTSEIDVILQAIIDPAAGEISDPDDLEARRESLPSGNFTTKLASGRAIAITLPITLP